MFQSFVLQRAFFYFLIRFAQRPGALKEFVNQVLGPDDDITRFEYMQKHNKETGPALVGVELTSKHDYELLLQNMQQYHINYTELKKDDNAFGYLVWNPAPPILPKGREMEEIGVKMMFSKNEVYKKQTA